MKIETVISNITLQMQEVKCELLKWIQEDTSVLHYKLHDGGWSSLQVLKHITLTSHFLLIIIDKASIKARKRAEVTPVQTDWENYELLSTSLTEIGIHKSFTWIRPEHMEPTGNVPHAEIQRKMLEQFDRIEMHLHLLRHGEGTLCKTTMTVNGLGKLDVYQYIYFLILHAQRHLTQLEKNKTEFESGINNTKQ